MFASTASVLSICSTIKSDCTFIFMFVMSRYNVPCNVPCNVFCTVHCIQRFVYNCNVPCSSPVLFSNVHCNVRLWYLDWVQFFLCVPVIFLELEYKMFNCQGRRLLWKRSYHHSSTKTRRVTVLYIFFSINVICFFVCLLLQKLVEIELNKFYLLKLIRGADSKVSGFIVTRTIIIFDTDLELKKRTMHKIINNFSTSYITHLLLTKLHLLLNFITIGLSSTLCSSHSSSESWTLMRKLTFIRILAMRSVEWFCTNTSFEIHMETWQFRPIRTNSTVHTNRRVHSVALQPTVYQFRC